MTAESSSKGACPVSVAIPAHDAAETLPRVLGAIEDLPAGWEILVVDDHSSDETAEIARRHGVRVIVSDGFLDHGAARNTALRRTRGEIVVFVDADVETTGEAIRTLVDRLRGRGVAALFAVYNRGDHLEGLISRYKNYWIRYSTMRAPDPPRWLNTALVAIHREALEAVGGFDESFSTRTGGCDVLFGYRLVAAGYRVGIDRRSEIAHLKEFTLTRWIRNDFHRARGWLRLAADLHRLRELARKPALANVGRDFTAGILLILVAAACLVGLLFSASFWPLPLGALAAAALLTLPVALSARREGVRGWLFFPLLMMIDQLACALAISGEVPRLLWRRFWARPDRVGGAIRDAGSLST